MEITKGQMTALQRAYDTPFVQRVAKDARANLPEETARFTDTQMLTITRQGFSRARSYGFQLRYPLALFVEMMFIVAPGWDKHPSAQKALANRDGSEHQRIDKAVDLTLFEIAEARQGSSDADWGLAPKGAN